MCHTILLSISCTFVVHFMYVLSTFHVSCDTCDTLCFQSGRDSCAEGLQHWSKPYREVHSVSTGSGCMQDKSLKAAWNNKFMLAIDQLTNPVLTKTSENNCFQMDFTWDICSHVDTYIKDLIKTKNDLLIELIWFAHGWIQVIHIEVSVEIRLCIICFVSLQICNKISS